MIPMEPPTGIAARPAARCGVLELDAESFGERIAAGGGKSVHARILRRLVLQRGPIGFAAAAAQGAALPAALCRYLEDSRITATVSELLSTRPSADGSTKLLLALADGNRIESVVMRGSRAHSVCVSTQVGCPVGCPFCASGLGGLVRNLAPHEILEQVVWARRFGTLSRVVLMGIGEPLLNLEGVLPALATLVEESSWPAHRITISTVGWPECLRALAESGARYRLALSLHAADDATRALLVPSMRSVPVAEVVAAARRYATASGAKVQAQYVVLAGINDGCERVDQLAELLADLPVYLNFISWNPVPELSFRRPEDPVVEAMVRHARHRGLIATWRRSRAQDVDGACGQLRRQLAASGSR